MLINLFNTLRSYGVPVSLKEFLDLLRGLEKQLVFANWEDFYFLSRTILVKDEKYFDKFDRAFDVYFRGISNMDDVIKRKMLMERCDFIMEHNLLCDEASGCRSWIWH